MKLRVGMLLAVCAAEHGWAGAQEVLAPAETSEASVDAVLPDAPAVVLEGACTVMTDGPKAWLGFDYLGWWAKGDKLPPLVSGSPAGTPRATAGVLGQPATTTLFGDRTVGEG